MSSQLARTAVAAVLVLACRLQPCAAAPAPAPSAANQWNGYVIHLFDYVSGYNGDQHLCSPPGTELYVGADDGSDTLTVSAQKVDPSKYLQSKPPNCTTGTGYIQESTSYTISKATLKKERFTTQTLVTGVLAIPFKFHFSDHSLTAGSTVGGYVGYQSSFFNQFTITPIVAGGLALISTTPAQASTSTTPASSSSSSQTFTGLSIATGLIGTVLSGSSSSSGAQIGFVVGFDWLSKSSNYAYNGKPWIAFEMGYKFTQ